MLDSVQALPVDPASCTCATGCWSARECQAQGHHCGPSWSCAFPWTMISWRPSWTDASTRSALSRVDGAHPSSAEVASHESWASSPQTAPTTRPSTSTTNESTVLCLTSQRQPHKPSLAWHRWPKLTSWTCVSGSWRRRRHKESSTLTSRQISSN